MKRIAMKDKLVLLIVALAVVSVLAVQYTKAQTQPSTVNPLSFYAPFPSINAGATEDRDFCSVQSDPSIGGSILWQVGKTDFFRIGANLATVNSLGAITVTKWQFAPVTGNDLTAADLGATVNAAGKIVLTNTSAFDRDVTHGMTICIRANITAVGSPIISIIDNSNTLVSSVNPREALFTVQ